MTSTKVDKRAAFMAALVAAFGEGAVVSRKQLIEVWDKNPEKYCHIVTIRKSEDYKVGRNQYVVTTQENPTVARDEARKRLAEVEAKQEKAVPAAVRKSPAKLAKKLLTSGLTKPERKAKETSGQGALETLESDDDINAILAVHRGG